MNHSVPTVPTLDSNQSLDQLIHDFRQKMIAYQQDNPDKHYDFLQHFFAYFRILEETKQLLQNPTADMPSKSNELMNEVKSTTRDFISYLKSAQATKETQHE